MIARKLYNRFLVWLGVRHTAPLRAPKAKRKPLHTCPICGGDWLIGLPNGKAVICSFCRGNGVVTETQYNKLTDNMIGETK